MIHETAFVSDKARIGEGTKIWHLAQVRENAIIGENCIIGKNSYIGAGVKIGSNVKIQNNCSIYEGAIIGDGVFIGPHVVLTNDRNPRAINPNGTLKSPDDWHVGKILVQKGSSIGACSVIVTDVTIGEFAMVGAGSVVTKDIPPYALAYGNSAQFRGYVCKCGQKADFFKSKGKLFLKCGKCSSEWEVEKK